MDFPDMLKFLNRIGIRPVNDVTAQVTADVTAAMDPEGMGVHMGAHAEPLPLMATKDELMATKDELRQLESSLAKKSADLSKEHYIALGTVSNGHYSALTTVHDSAMNVIVKKVDQIIHYVDEKVAGIDERMVDADKKVAGIDERMVDVDEKLTNMKTQFEKRLKSLEKPQKKQKTKAIRSTVSPNISFVHGKYAWRKTISGIDGYKGTYKTLDDAKNGLQQFCEEHSNPAAAIED